MPTRINNALMRLSKRAETQDEKRLVDTFVDNGPLFTLLSREDHQVIYGRRGTGKTHALSYLAEKRQELGDCVVLLDLRTIGSTGGLYGDANLPISERGTRLLCDTLAAFHGGLLDFFITHAEELNLSEAGAILDRLRAAARDWYQRDKDAAVRSSSGAHKLLHWIIEEVIGHRHARAFLLRTDTNHDLINSLFDSRVLHILKRNIAAHDQPGVRYDAFKLDYGCYVDFISTAKAPQGLLQGVNEEGKAVFVDVPPDDYRAIRRAILELSEFEKSLTAQ